MKCNVDTKPQGSLALRIERKGQASVVSKGCTSRRVFCDPIRLQKRMTCSIYPEFISHTSDTSVLTALPTAIEGALLLVGQAMVMSEQLKPVCSPCLPFGTEMACARLSAVFDHNSSRHEGCAPLRLCVRDPQIAVILRYYVTIIT